MSTRRDFTETERTPGWAHYKGLVESAIATLKVDLATIETEGKSAEQVGMEHVRIEERIAGLTRALTIPADIHNEIADDL